MTEDFIKQVKSIAWLMLAIAAVVYVYQFGRSVDQSYPNRTFSVDGESKMETATDIATFTASVTTEGGKNVADIQKQNVDKMNTINAFLKDQGVEKKDLQTSQYSLTPRYTYYPCDGKTACPPATISGYTLTQTLTIKVRNLETVGDILSGIVEKGANNVSGISFTVDDDSVARQVARTDAIAKAKLKAEEIAKAGGFRLGKLMSLYEDNGVVPTDNTGYGGMSANSSAEAKVAAPPVIEAGTQSGTVHINLTYEIIN